MNFCNMIEKFVLFWAEEKFLICCRLAMCCAHAGGRRHHGTGRPQSFWGRRGSRQLHKVLNWCETRLPLALAIEAAIETKQTAKFKIYDEINGGACVVLTATGLTHVVGVTLWRLLSATSGAWYPCRPLCCNRSRTCNVSFRRGILPANSFSSVHTFPLL